MNSSAKCQFVLPSPLHDINITPAESNLALEYEIFKVNNQKELKLACTQENQLQTVPVSICFRIF